MKLIQALKKMKDLARKEEDLRKKIADHSAYLSNESPVYPDQKKQVSEWLQAHSDILKEILRLRICIQRTNLNTQVEIELGGKHITKSIAEWIHRRRDLANAEFSAWRGLTDRKLKEGTVLQSTGQQTEVRIIRCFDPAERDKNLDMFKSEPSIIDGNLEIANAITDLEE